MKIRDLAVAALATALSSGVALAEDPAPDVLATPATADAADAQSVEAIAVEQPAEVSETAATPASEGNRMIEEIIVTATKREENVQDLPQSVTAFSSDMLEAVGVSTVQDLPNITPGLTITNQAGYNQAFLRGVGTDAFLPGADPSVPFYVDGIPLLGTQGSSDSLGKIRRVEVLKGPQGTLFGTNSIGGAINIITPDPDQGFSGDLQGGTGNYRSRQGALYTNLPIADALTASVALFGDEQDNLYVNDAGDVIDVYSWGGRAKLRWDLTDEIANTVGVTYNKSSNNAGLTFENTLPAPRINGVSPIPADPQADRHVSYDGFKVGAVNHSWLVSDTLTWTLPWLDVKGIGSWQELTSDDVLATFGAGSAALASQNSTSTQVTGELQFLSNADTPLSDRLTWVAGLFYIGGKGGLDPVRFVLGSNLASFVPGLTDSPLIGTLETLGLYDPTAAIEIHNRGVIKSYAISGYFQGTYAVTDALNLIVGSRYQHARKELTKSSTSLPRADGSEVVLVSDDLPVLHSNQLSPRVGLQYVFDDEMQAYASWARGYKTPTYNTVNLLGSTLEPIKKVKAQRNDAYEIGLKSELFDRNLRLNTAAFYTKEKNLLTGIVQVLSGGIVNYDNAPAARIYGVEADALWTPMPTFNPGLAISLAGAWLDTKYTDYKNGRGYDADTGLAYGPGNVLPLLPERDQTGNEIPRSPDFTGNLAINQSIALPSGFIEIGVDASYNSGFFWSPQNVSEEETKAYELLNAHATWSYDPWGLQLSFWAKNILQETYSQIIFTDDFGRSQVLNDPRTLGFRAKLTF